MWKTPLIKQAQPFVRASICLIWGRTDLHSFVDQNPSVVKFSILLEGTLYVFSSINQWFGQVCLFYRFFFLQSPASFNGKCDSPTSPESCAAKPKSHSLKISATHGRTGCGIFIVSQIGEILKARQKDSF